jgi:hypothetical protein
MHALLIVTLTCWLCTLVAIPRKPPVSDEVAELVYRRLLGRQQRLALLAFIATGALFLTVVLSLPQRVDATLDSPPLTETHASRGCNDEMLCLSTYQP